MDCLIVLVPTLTTALTVTGGGTLDVDNVGLNVGNNGGVINQSRWVLVVALLGWKESSNVGLQPLDRPTGESTLNEALHSEIGNVLFGEFCRSHGIIDMCFRHQKKDVDELFLLCRVDCKSPGMHGE